MLIWNGPVKFLRKGDKLILGTQEGTGFVSQLLAEVTVIEISVESGSVKVKLDKLLGIGGHEDVAKGDEMTVGTDQLAIDTDDQALVATILRRMAD